MTAPLVSVVVAIAGPDAQPREVIDAFGKVLVGGGYGCEFVVVLDGPGARFEQDLLELGTRWTVRIVRLEGGGLGESIALSAGVAKSKGDLVVNVPPYLQIEPEDVLKVVKALEAGADCVATWRHSRIDPWLNQLQSRFFNFVLRLIMNMPFHDLNSGTRGFRRHVLEEVAVYGELYRFLPVLAQRQGFRVVEVRVRHREEKGRSGFYGIGVYLRRFLDILAITFLTRFTQRPLRFFGNLGFAAIAIGGSMTVYYLYTKVALNQGLGDRPGFVFGAMLAAMGVMFIGFGLIGEIIIFTQAPNLRDFKVEDRVEGGADEAERSTGEFATNGAGHTQAVDDAASPSAPAMLRERRHDEPAAKDAALREVGPREPAETGVQVRELLPGEDSRWDSYVSRHPQGTFFHRSGWSRVVAETFRHEPHHLVVESGRRWIGVLPLFLAKSPFLGRNLISVPYAVYGGVLADDERAEAALLTRAGALGRELDVGYVELRHLEPRAGDRPRSPLYVTFRCELPDSPDDVMPLIPKKARAEVRCARDPAAPAILDGSKKRRESFGIKVTADGSVDELFALFADNKRRLGSPALPHRWFQGLADEFGKAAVIHRAIDPRGKTLAAVMSFTFKDTVYAYYSGSLPRVEHTGVNNWIYCAIMEWAVERGYTRFDFGRSRVDSGPAMFKKHMGFTAEPLHYEYMLIGRGAKIPDFHPSNPRLDLPRRLWSHLPMFVCNPLGSRLSRYIP